MSTPLGEFLRARRDATRPESLGLRPDPGPRRVPGLRRSELAALAGISVEYLVRLEQGRDRSPSISVITALAAALRLGGAERDHFVHLAKVSSSSTCLRALPEPRREVRPAVRALLDQLEPGIAYLTNVLGDVLAHTSGFDLLAGPTGLLDGPAPNLTRFVFTDERSRAAFPDWARFADECAAALGLGPPDGPTGRLVTELTARAGPAFTGRLHRHQVPDGAVHRWRHPAAGELRLVREVLELPAGDAQQVVVLLPVDEATAAALDGLRRTAGGPLRAVT